MTECRIAETTGKCMWCGSTEKILTVEFTGEKPVSLCFSDFRQSWNNRTVAKKVKVQKGKTEPVAPKT